MTVVVIVSLVDTIEVVGETVAASLVDTIEAVLVSLTDATEAAVVVSLEVVVLLVGTIEVVHKADITDK